MIGTYHSALISKEGSSETRLKRAFPPIIFSRVREMASRVIEPSWGANLFLLPGLSTTTLSAPS